MMGSLAILGASGHGKVIADAAKLSGWNKISFFDDAWPKIKKNSHWPIIGNTDSLLNSGNNFDGIIVAIGNNKIRQEKSRLLTQLGLPLVNIIHPTAIVSKYSEIGIGTFISANATIQTDTVIGDFSIINTGSIIEHDCLIGNAVHICPNASLAGGVIVGDLSWIGLSACVIQQIKIGNDCYIGAGSTVINDIPNNTTVVGNPAKPLIKN